MSAAVFGPKSKFSFRLRNDVTITHSDLSYMQKHYETAYRPELNAQSTGKDDDEAFRFAEKSFRPLYYIKVYEEDKSKIEMSFDLTQCVAPLASLTQGADHAADLPAINRSSGAFRPTGQYRTALQPPPRTL